jgi:hypothetical protein
LLKGDFCLLSRESATTVHATKILFKVEPVYLTIPPEPSLDIRPELLHPVISDNRSRRGHYGGGESIRKLQTGSLALGNDAF